MDYQHLGKSGLKVSKIGFGCMSLKGAYADVEKTLHKAIDLGINFFDTADLYDKGQNEKWVGKALAHKRSNIIIATKVGNQLRSNGSGWDWNPTKAYILTAVEASLKRLQTDYIDLYQLHGGTINDDIDDTIEAFELLKRQGKIRHYGISSIRHNVIQAYVRKSYMVSVMMQYSLLDRRPEEIAFSLLQNNIIGVLARGTLAGGMLGSKSATDYLAYTTEQVAAAARAVKLFSGQQRRATQTALQFVLNNAAVTSAIVGIRNNDQLEDAVSALSAPPLTEREMEVLRQSIKINYYEQHR